MVRRTAFLIVLGVLALTAQPVFAQFTVMPVPGARVLDADGKVMAQVVDLGTYDSYPRVMLKIDGVTGAFTVMPERGWFYSAKVVYFSAASCTGVVVAITPPASTGMDAITQTSFAAVGPDRTLGTYAVYRSTSSTPASFSPASQWASGECLDITGSVTAVPAEPVTPNPLDGFHGPTTVAPERVLTIEGGDWVSGP
jgi:hypothetical protein